MKRKLLIIPLLLALALLPVAQALSPAVVPAQHAHEGMLMDCGQLDPGQCPDFDSCVSGSHASCEAKAKATPVSPAPADRPRGQAYAADSPGRYLSHHAELLLRPPRYA